jgi:hypothetical protein
MTLLLGCLAFATACIIVMIGFESDKGHLSCVI